MSARTYLLCEIHGERFAFDVEHVDEVVRMPWVTAIAETPDDVEGVVNYRGNCIAVVDPALRLAGEASEPGPDSYLVIVRVDDAQVALVVDQVDDLASTERKLPPRNAAAPGFVLGHLDDTSGLATIIDVAALLRPEVHAFVARARESEVPPP